MRDKAAENVLRDRARKLQALHIRLLFCPITQENWLTESVTVLDAFGLPPEMQGHFPDITTDQFKAESHGRRTLVERSIGQTFAETQQHLKVTKSNPTFDDFICSEEFFDPKSGLPHTPVLDRDTRTSANIFSG